MAMQVSHNTWRLEFNEATDAWRTFFFQVQFQVLAYIQCYRYYDSIYRDQMIYKVSNLHPRFKQFQQRGHSQNVREKDVKER